MEASPRSGTAPSDTGPTATRPPNTVPSSTGPSSTVLTVLQEASPVIPHDAGVMTVLIELPPAGPGTPPHRHAGPVFGYMLAGEMVFELEGEPERVIRAGEAFWEPGGDVIHYQAANNLADAWSRFVVVMMCVPGQPMLTLVGEEELAGRRSLRFPGAGGKARVAGPGLGNSVQLVILGAL
jgi:quercetin dioxygenase-like cupin family protein